MPTTSKPVGIGVVGVGFGRQVHIPGFKKIKNARVIGVASNDFKQAQRAARDYSLPYSFRSWRDLINCPEVDAVSIATPPDSHAAIAIAAARAGKAVFCEKQLALKSSDAEKMVRAVKAARVVNMVNFEYRELEALTFAKKFLAAGKLGRLRHVNVTWISKNWANPRRPWSWRSLKSKGGGCLGALGIHVFDYLQWLLGPIEAVSAQVDTRIAKRPDRDGRWRAVDSEDCCHIILRLKDKTPVSVVLSVVAPMSRGHWLEIHGEKKALVVGSRHPYDYAKGFNVWMSEYGPDETREKTVLAHPSKKTTKDSRLFLFMPVAKRFVDAVQKNNLRVHPSFEDGLKAQRVLDAVQRASKTKTWVKI